MGRIVNDLNTAMTVDRDFISERDARFQVDASPLLSSANLPTPAMGF